MTRVVEADEGGGSGGEERRDDRDVVNEGVRVNDE